MKSQSNPSAKAGENIEHCWNFPRNVSMENSPFDFLEFFAEKKVPPALDRAHKAHSLLLISRTFESVFLCIASMFYSFYLHPNGVVECITFIRLRIATHSRMMTNARAWDAGVGQRAGKKLSTHNRRMLRSATRAGRREKFCCFTVGLLSFLVRHVCVAVKWQNNLLTLEIMMPAMLMRIFGPFNSR